MNTARITPILILFLFVFFLVACSSDDDNGNPLEKQLEGTWLLIDIESEEYGEYDLNQEGVITYVYRTTTLDQSDLKLTFDTDPNLFKVEGNHTGIIDVMTIIDGDTTYSQTTRESDTDTGILNPTWFVQGNNIHLRGELDGEVIESVINYTIVGDQLTTWDKRVDSTEFYYQKFEEKMTFERL